MLRIVHFNQMYIARISGGDDGAVCTGEMRGKAASPTVLWPSLREAGRNWNSQGVPASLGIRAGSTESLQVSQSERQREKEGDGFSTVSRSESF